MKFPTIKEMAEEVAEKALDEIEYNGKTIREWVEIILATDTNVATKDSTNLASLGMNCISRQAAIDAARDWYEGLICGSFKGLEKRLRALPPAQPEPCEDAVSRKTILKFLDDWMSALEDNVHNQSASDLKIIKKDFENLPPVTPKQRTGKWIKCGWAITCSECGYDMPYTVRNFCPNCGADMREVTA